MQQHFNEVSKLVKLGEKSDSHAKHFATQFNDTNLSPVNQRGGMTCNIIWQRNPINVVKTFTCKNCAMCAKERIAILNNPDPTHNFLSTLLWHQIYGACRHRPRFHVCAKQTTPNTDESINDKRAIPSIQVATDFTRCNVCLTDVQLEALWGPTKRNYFLFISKTLPAAFS